MPQNPLYAEERRRKIVQIVETKSRCSVAELAELFSVTQATVRNDLSALEENGKIVRTYGGAISLGHIESEDLPIDRMRNNPGKQSVAAKAASFVEDKDILAIDTGTTALAFAQALARSPRRDLKIVSADFTVLMALEDRADFELFSLGGRVRHGFHFCCGEVTSRALEGYRVQKCFLAANGVDISEGLTTSNAETAQLKRHLMTISRETYLMVDSSKFGKVFFSRFGDISEVDHVVVDSEIDPVVRKRLEDKTSDLVIA